MRPGSFVNAARRGRCPPLPGEQILLAGARTFHKLPNALAQNRGRSLALGAAPRATQ